MPKNTRPRSYHFSLGNSTKGPIGFCAQVKAYSKEEAVEILKEILPEEWDTHFQDDDRSIEYCCVYFNPDAISVRSIDDWEDADEEDE
jgi:hypothetical protein